jgi:Short C-terminal domain
MIRRGFGRIGRPGLLGTVARTGVVAGTATAVSGAMIRHRNERDEQAQEARAYEQQQAVGPVYATPDPVSSTPITDELERLADLKDRGLLTDAEFETQKARVLNG